MRRQAGRGGEGRKEQNDSERWLCLHPCTSSTQSRAQHRTGAQRLLAGGLPSECKTLSVALVKSFPRWIPVSLSKMAVAAWSGGQRLLGLSQAPSGLLMPTKVTERVGGLRGCPLEGRRCSGCEGQWPRFLCDCRLGNAGWEEARAGEGVLCPRQHGRGGEARSDPGMGRPAHSAEGAGRGHRPARDPSRMRGQGEEVMRRKGVRDSGH